MKKLNFNRGRTFWDLIAEHPKMIFVIMILLTLMIVFLTLNKYSVKMPMFAIEPEKSMSIPSDLKIDTQKIRKVFTIDTSSSIKNKFIADPPKSSVNKQQIKMQHPKEELKTEVVNITSNGQKGGITANQVNIGTVPRELNLTLQNQLLLFLKDKNERIDLTSVMGDPESFQFAKKIFDFLKSQGFTQIDDVAQAVFRKPKIGQFMDRNSSGVSIIIGSKPNP